MNELLFFLHLSLIFLCTLVALRIGKEALIGWIMLSSMLANLFVLKQITLFSFQATCTDAFILGLMLGLNLLQEYYGAATAKRTTYYSFGAMALFILLSKIHLFYAPAASDWADPSYAAILASSPRIVFASLATFFLVQQFDVRLFALLKKHFSKMRLVFRATFCLLISQAIDTALFTFLGLYGLVDQIISVLLVSFTIKAIIALCSAPFTALTKKLALRPS